MASVYLVLKLESMNPQYCTGFENACCRGGSCEKLVFQPYRQRMRGYLRD